MESTRRMSGSVEAIPIETKYKICRYATPVGGGYRTPEPRDDSPEQTIGGKRPIVMYKKGQAPIKPDVGFDENSLKVHLRRNRKDSRRYPFQVSADQISSEIKKGTVASKMGAMAKLMGLSDGRLDHSNGTIDFSLISLLRCLLSHFNKFESGLYERK